MKKGFKILASADAKPALWDAGVRANTLFPSAEAAEAMIEMVGLQGSAYEITAVVVTSHRIR